MRAAFSAARAAPLGRGVGVGRAEIGQRDDLAAVVRAARQAVERDDVAADVRTAEERLVGELVAGLDQLDLEAVVALDRGGGDDRAVATGDGRTIGPAVTHARALRHEHRRVEQHGVLADHAALRPVDLEQEVQERLGHGGAGS